MGDLITKDGIGVKVGINQQDIILLVAALMFAGILAAVLSGLILRSI